MFRIYNNYLLIMKSVSTWKTGAVLALLASISAADLPKINVPLDVPVILGTEDSFGESC